MLALLLVLQTLPPKQDEVDNAIKRGADYLLAIAGQGSLEPSISSGMELNYDAFILYTLNHAGADKNEANYRILVDRVVNKKITRTYTAATTALALREHDPTRYKAKIFECGQFLVDNMCTNGQWDYGREYDIPKPKALADSGSTKSRIRIQRSKKLQALPHGDNSNSQYAAMGLFACWMAGFDIETEVLDKAISWWETSQNSDGSWDYGEQGGKIKPKEGGFGSMTAGGASSIILLRRCKGQTGKFGAPGKAITWVGEHFTVTENPGGPSDRKRFQFYYLYALERLGDLHPTQKMGKHDWYAEGATYLVKTQKGGMWQGPFAGMEIADTCFAILFLHRSMKVATGETKK